MTQRIQLQRTRGWRKPEGSIVVSRPSRWGNPFGVSEYGLDLSIALYRDMCIGVWSPTTAASLGDKKYDKAYRAAQTWRKRIGVHPLEAIRSELAGHDLCCWCALDAPCHADVLLELAGDVSGSNVMAFFTRMNELGAYTDGTADG